MRSSRLSSGVGLIFGMALALGLLSGCSTASVVTKVNALPSSLQGRTFVIHPVYGSEPYVSVVTDDLIRRGMVPAPAGGRAADFDILIRCEYGQNVGQSDASTSPFLETA
jgi:hypothetical protein